MFEYKFVKVSVFDSAEDIINNYAKSGWKVVQIIPRSTDGNSPLGWFVLFEKEKK